MKSGNSWKGFAKGHLTSGPRCHSEKVIWKRKESCKLAVSQTNEAFFLKDFLLERFESSPCLGCANTTLQLVSVATEIVGAQVFVLVNDMYSQSHTEW